MKLRIALLAALLCFAGLTSQAQTNTAPSFSAGLEQMAQALTSSTNWTLVGGAGRSLKGNRNIAFGDVCYAFNDNVGAVIGVDTLWAPNQGVQQQQNTVKGGITLSATIHPFAFVGSSFATSIVGTPFVTGLIAQPTGGSSSGVSTIITEGINFNIVSFKNFELVAGAQYETRSDAGFWNGNYALIHLGISRNF